MNSRQYHSPECLKRLGSCEHQSVDDKRDLALLPRMAAGGAVIDATFEGPHADDRGFQAFPCNGDAAPSRMESAGRSHRVLRWLASIHWLAVA